MSGEYREDIRHLLERYEKAPDSRLFAPLADAYRKNGDIDKAIELCEKGLERYPTYASAHVILGKCFYDKGATERARSEFLRVVELDQDNMVALKFLGDILLAEGDREGAAQYYRRLLAIDPTNEEVEAALGELEGEFHAPKIDLADETRVRKADNASELATMTLAGIYAAQGYYNKALKIYQDVIRNEPGNAQAREMVEKLQAMMGASEEERKGVFEDEVLTISLDDVSEDVASSTVGGGIDGRADAGDRPAAKRREKKPAAGGGGADDFAEAVRELDEAEERPPAEPETVRSEGRFPEEKVGEREEEEQQGETAPKMENFQQWIRKLKSDRDKK